jgi:GMP synthase (glutamine-hydrolysing)
MQHGTTGVGDPGEVIVLRHVPWEHLGGFARCLDDAGCTTRYINLFDGDRVPDLMSARAVIAMGGPMSVHDVDEYPFLVAEIDAIGDAVRAGVPFLGVCLGSQLLATALGASVTVNPRGKELGWHRVTMGGAAPDDAIFRSFHRSETVLHWHGEVFEPPAGAVSLASSERTECQAFRWGKHAWGLLFHLEADPSLISTWLEEPSMHAEATAVDAQLPGRIRADAPLHAPRLRELQDIVIGRLLQLPARAIATRGAYGGPCGKPEEPKSTDMGESGT